MKTSGVDTELLIQTQTLYQKMKMMMRTIKLGKILKILKVKHLWNHIQTQLKIQNKIRSRLKTRLTLPYTLTKYKIFFI